MRASLSSQVHDSRGFSLLELLVVIGLIVILASFAVPAVNSVMQSGNISRATTQVVSSFTLAAQMATSENRPVTARLIAGPDGIYSVIQLVARDAEGQIKALERPAHLPDTTRISTNATHSSFLGLDEITATSDDPQVADLGNSYKYREIEFRPDGRIGVSANNIFSNLWFLTVISANAPADDDLTDNYATVQVDPVNSRLSVYRP